MITITTIIFAMERTNNFLTVPNERQGSGFPKNNSTLQPNTTGRN